MPLPSTCYMDTPRRLVLPTVFLGAKGPIQTIGTEVTVQDWLNLGQQIKDQSSKGLPMSGLSLPSWWLAGSGRERLPFVLFVHIISDALGNILQ